MSYVHKHGLPTVEQASEKYPHGTRARYYLGKCKCFPCKLANSDYEQARGAASRGPWEKIRISPRVEADREFDANGKALCRYCSKARTRWGITRHEHACKSNPSHGYKIGWTVVHRTTGERAGGPENVFPTNAVAVAERDRLNKRDKPKPPNQYVSAKKVRAHLLSLQKQGVGAKAISKTCGVAYSSLQRLIRGMIKRTRRSTEAKILAVDLMTGARGGAKIDGRDTWKMIDALLGSKLYKKAWLAKWFGSNTPALQLGFGPNGRAFVKASTAHAVKSVYERLWATDARLRSYVDPAGERERAENVRAQAATNASRERLAKALKSWDVDEFAVRLSRFGDL